MEFHVLNPMEIQEKTSKYWGVLILVFLVRSFLQLITSLDAHLINIWQMFNLATDNLAVKPYIPHKSLLQ